MTPAVPAEIAPPAMDPAAGRSFKIFATTALPSKVAPPEPIVDDKRAVITDLFTSKPNITVIEAIMPTWVGIKSAASAKGIGAAPWPVAASAAVATTLEARRFFRINSLSAHVEEYLGVPQVGLLPLLQLIFQVQKTLQFQHLLSQSPWQGQG